jgi:hypothetical protein
MELVIGWIIFAGLAGFYASKLNRNALGYFILSIFLSPLITFIFLLIAGENKNNQKKASLESKKIYQRYRTEVQLDYDKALIKALKFYENYNLYPSQYNTDDDYEKVFKNDNDQSFVIKKVNGNVIIESSNLPVFQDINNEIIEPKKTNVDDLVKISELFEKGLLTKEEFEAQKTKLLNT